MPTENAVPVDELILIGPASRILGVAPETVRIWADNGKLSSQRTSGGVRIFLTSDVEAMRQKREKRKQARAQ